MNKLKEKLIRFMYGRYGIDRLYYVLLALSVVLMLINAFVNSVILYIAGWVILGIVLFRALSRNIYKRQAENQRFMKYWNKVKPQLSVTGNRLKEIKSHRYRKCPHCKAMLRLPRRTGKHAVTCPRCHRDFDVRVLF